MRAPLNTYCDFLSSYLKAAPGELVVVPYGVTRAELEGVARARQLKEQEDRRMAYADWMAN